jgi:hypothetical protein
MCLPGRVLPPVADEHTLHERRTSPSACTRDPRATKWRSRISINGANVAAVARFLRVPTPDGDRCTLAAADTRPSTTGGSRTAAVATSSASTLGGKPTTTSLRSTAATTSPGRIVDGGIGMGRPSPAPRRRSFGYP